MWAESGTIVGGRGDVNSPWSGPGNGPGKIDSKIDRIKDKQI